MPQIKDEVGGFLEAFTSTFMRSRENAKRQQMAAHGQSLRAYSARRTADLSQERHDLARDKFEFEEKKYADAHPAWEEEGQTFLPSRFGEGGAQFGFSNDSGQMLFSPGVQGGKSIPVGSLGEANFINEQLAAAGGTTVQEEREKAHRELLNKITLEATVGQFGDSPEGQEIIASFGEVLDSDPNQFMARAKLAGVAMANGTMSPAMAVARQNEIVGFEAANARFDGEIERHTQQIDMMADQEKQLRDRMQQIQASMDPMLRPKDNRGRPHPVAEEQAAQAGAELATSEQVLDELMMERSDTMRRIQTLEVVRAVQRKPGAPRSLSDPRNAQASTELAQAAMETYRIQHGDYPVDLVVGSEEYDEFKRHFTRLVKQGRYTP